VYFHIRGHNSPALKISRITRLLPVCFLPLLAASQADGFALDDSSWPVDSTVVMQLELGPTGVFLQDGLGTWDNSAADALAQWNLYLDLIEFNWVLGSNAPKGSPDGFNSVFYSNTIFGDDFGDDTLAVTVWWTTDTYPFTKTEADVVFNYGAEI
jgi:hypothetical protein